MIYKIYTWHCVIIPNTMFICDQTKGFKTRLNWFILMIVSLFFYVQCTMIVHPSTILCIFASNLFIGKNQSFSETWVVCVQPPDPFCLKLRSLVICDLSDLHRSIQYTQHLQCYISLGWGELMMLLIKALVKDWQVSVSGSQRASGLSPLAFSTEPCWRT